MTRLERAHLGATAFTFVAVWGLYLGVPAARPALYREGHPVENLTAGLFLAAAVVGAVRMRRQGLRWHRHPLGLILLLGILGFLDEMSWGTRDLPYEAPIIEGLRVDGLHDLILFPYVWYVEYGSLASRAAVAGLLAGIVLLLVVTRRYVLGPLARVVLAPGPWWFVTVAAGFVVAAMIVDLDLVRGQPVKVLEELLELNGGLALLFAALAIGQPAPAAGGVYRPGRSR
jgi:hypothetical protein